MKRYVALAMLAASLLAGCGTTPALQTNPALNGNAAAASVETGAQIQIYKAFKRVEASKQLRVVIMYWVRNEGQDREFRQLILDSVPTTDRVVYRSGYRPMQMVANGKNLLLDEATLLKIARELGELNYHTVTKEQKELVSLAYEIVMDQVH
jgi:hypothetical protein